MKVLILKILTLCKFNFYTAHHNIICLCFVRITSPLVAVITKFLYPEPIAASEEIWKVSLPKEEHSRYWGLQGEISIQLEAFTSLVESADKEALREQDTVFSSRVGTFCPKWKPALQQEGTSPKLTTRTRRDSENSEEPENKRGILRVVFRIDRACYQVMTQHWPAVKTQQWKYH